jgi:CBS domain-containing protein
VKNVRLLLREKGADVWSVSPQTSVREAVRILAEKNIGALLVMDGGRLVGILSERDTARKMILQSLPADTTPVSQIMTTHVITITPEYTIQECMALMTDRRVRHLPVMEGDQLAGIISIGDVVKEIIADQEFTIQHLERYITGER